MPARNRPSKKKLRPEDRLWNARRWLKTHRLPTDLVRSYSARYGVAAAIAYEELMSLGYYDDILIQAYEKSGVRWKYMVEPRSGEMLVVPEETEEHELYLYHSFFL